LARPIVQPVIVEMATTFFAQIFSWFPLRILTQGEIPSIIDAHGFTFIIWWQCFVYHTYKYDLKGEEQPIHN
jgi:hypothetical protein